MQFIHFIETNFDGKERRVWLDPSQVCLVQETAEHNPLINSVIYLNNGEYIQTTEYSATVLAKLGITS